MYMYIPLSRYHIIIGTLFLCIFATDFDGFSVVPSQEVVEETFYSVLLSFAHDVIVHSVSQPGNGAHCNGNAVTGRMVALSCTSLLSATHYSLVLQGRANLFNNSELGLLEFEVMVDFSTGAPLELPTNETEQVVPEQQGY